MRTEVLSSLTVASFINMYNASAAKNTPPQGEEPYEEMIFAGSMGRKGIFIGTHRPNSARLGRDACRSQKDLPLGVRISTAPRLVYRSRLLGTPEQGTSRWVVGGTGTGRGCRGTCHSVGHPHPAPAPPRWSRPHELTPSPRCVNSSWCAVFATGAPRHASPPQRLASLMSSVWGVVLTRMSHLSSDVQASAATRVCRIVIVERGVFCHANWDRITVREKTAVWARMPQNWVGNDDVCSVTFSKNTNHSLTWLSVQVPRITLMTTRVGSKWAVAWLE